MNLTAEHIKEKRMIGKSGSGNPIVMIESDGGLYACFTRGADGQAMALAAAPHRGIMMFLAEKRDPGITWTEEIRLEQLGKSEQHHHDMMRDLMLNHQSNKLNKSLSDYYLIYDVVQDQVYIGHREEIKKSTSELSPEFLIRNLNLSDELQMIGIHPEFARLFE